MEEESNEAESNPVDQQDHPTQTPTNQSQVDSTSVSTEEQLGDNEVVTNGPVAESLKEAVVGADETTRVEVPTEGPEVQIPNKSQSMEFNLEKVLNTASKVTIDVNVNVLNTVPPNSSERLGEYVEQEDFKVEELSEGVLAEPTATKDKETPFTEVIQVKEDEVEMKLEIEDNHEKIQEKELNRSWMEEAINQPETFEIGLVRINTNDDSDDTIPWSPRVETLNLTESGAASGHDSDETILWSPRVKTLDRVSRVESGITSVSNKFHSLDEMSQDESEDENAPPFNLKESYVAMRSALKVVRKRNKKKFKLKRDKWHVNSEDTEWSPIQAKKPSTKIVLVKNRVQSSSPENSEDEQSQSESQSRLWKQNNHRWFPPTDRRHKQNQTPQKKQERVNDKQIRKLLLTDEKSQASLFQFYKSNWERQKLLKKESELKSELGLLQKTVLGGKNSPSIHQCGFSS